MTNEYTFEGWFVVELLGHRRVAGYVSEVQLAGAGFLRLDIPETRGRSAQTQFIAPGSVYRLHLTTEEIACAAAGTFRSEPVHRWELESVHQEPRRPEVLDEWPDDDGDQDEEVSR